MDMIKRVDMEDMVINMVAIMEDMAVYGHYGGGYGSRHYGGHGRNDDYGKGYGYGRGYDYGKGYGRGYRGQTGQWILIELSAMSSF